MSRSDIISIMVGIVLAVVISLTLVPMLGGALYNAFVFLGN